MIELSFEAWAPFRLARSHAENRTEVASRRQIPNVVQGGQWQRRTRSVAPVSTTCAVLAEPERLRRCVAWKRVAEHGGLTGATGTLKMQFLVRARGRAEGVEVMSAKGLTADAASCVRVLLKNKPIGPPRADPVGVTVTIALEPPSK
jgi:hypothetical protein